MPEIDTKDIKIPDKIMTKWQNIVNIIADIIEVKAVLIMRVDPPYIEVFRASQSDDNPYQIGEREPLAGLYCEKVIKTDKKVSIPNSIKDERWENSPEIDLGLISYLGFPLKWPDGDVFGTLCVLDSQETYYSTRNEKLVKYFKEFIESHLKYIYQNRVLKNNIKEKKQAESSLKEKNSTLSVLFNNLPGMAYKCKYDKKWTMKFVSKGCHDLTGYHPEELINNNQVAYGNLIIPEHRARVWKKIKISLKKQQSFKVEYKIRSKNNQEKWVWEQGQGVYNNNDDLINIQGFITDITERKNQEEKIKYLSYHDNLTGLYNRQFLEEEIERLDVKRQLPISLIMADLNGLKLINDSYGHIVGDRVLKKTGEILTKICRDEDIIARWGGDEFIILLPRTTKNESKKISQRISGYTTEINTEQEKNNKIPVSIACGHAVKEKMSENIYDVLQIAENKMYNKKLTESKSTKNFMLQNILNSLSNKSDENKKHFQRMEKMALKIGRKYNLTQSELDRLKLLSSAHDIGKSVISEDVLNKPDLLTYNEWEIIKEHPKTGYQICSATSKFSHIANDILSHHEYWNGNGYPRGIAREEISFLARIISVVDAYDVMTHNRPYSKAISQQEALNELKRKAGVQFDPGIVKVFTKLI
ncbi:MAG: diguanylate cyclase domain-containing protein [Bacillota bacterium]